MVILLDRIQNNKKTEFTFQGGRFISTS